MGTPDDFAVLVRWECGCRGVRATDGKAYVFWDCCQNGEDPEYTMYRREDCESKSFAPMKTERVRITLDVIGEAFRKADEYDRLTRALQGALRPLLLAPNDIRRTR